MTKSQVKYYYRRLDNLGYKKESDQARRLMLSGMWNLSDVKKQIESGSSVKHIEKEKPSEKKHSKKVYSREEVEKKFTILGFKGFRDWAKETFGVTGRAASGLIQDIMDVQSGKKSPELPR